jgi:predicted amidophosphoribosyltransferase
MFWLRRLHRQVNSAQTIARTLAASLHVPAVGGLLVRVRNTFPQKDLSPEERARNVRGAFQVPRRRCRRAQGSRVLLVDDILTTGATCSEAAWVLKQAGAVAVAAAVLARA